MGFFGTVLITRWKELSQLFAKEMLGKKKPTKKPQFHKKFSQEKMAWDADNIISWRKVY